MAESSSPDRVAVALGAALRAWATPPAPRPFAFAAEAPTLGLPAVTVAGLGSLSLPLSAESVAALRAAALGDERAGQRGHCLGRDSDATAIGDDASGVRTVNATLGVLPAAVIPPTTVPVSSAAFTTTDDGGEPIKTTARPLATPAKAPVAPTGDVPITSSCEGVVSQPPVGAAIMAAPKMAAAVQTIATATAATGDGLAKAGDGMPSVSGGLVVAAGGVAVAPPRYSVTPLRASPTGVEVAAAAPASREAASGWTGATPCSMTVPMGVPTSTATVIPISTADFGALATPNVATAGGTTSTAVAGDRPPPASETSAAAPVVLPVNEGADMTVESPAAPAAAAGACPPPASVRSAAAPVAPCIMEGANIGV